jgi:hypothetical protein
MRTWGLAIFIANTRDTRGDAGTSGLLRKSLKLPARFAPAAAATAAAVSTTATAVAAAAAESTALGAGTGFVHVQGAAVQFLTIQTLDGFHRLGLIGHLDKGEAAGLAGVAIANNAGLFNGAVRGKRGLELGLRGLISKVSNKDIRH